MSNSNFVSVNDIYNLSALSLTQQQEEPKSKMRKPKNQTEITVGDITSATLKQLLPPASHPTVYDLTPDVVRDLGNDPDAFYILSWDIRLSGGVDWSYTRGRWATTTRNLAPQVTNWHSIPTELRNKIYHHYFSTSTYTIHDPAVCACPECPSEISKDIFWQHPKSLSKTIHSNQTNLFLTSPEIIHEAHPIWLANSTFRFGPCILSDPIRLFKINIPVSRFASIRKFELTGTGFENTIAALDLLKERLDLSDGVAPPFKLIFHGDKIQFRLLWHRMMNPRGRRTHNGDTLDYRKMGLEGVKIEFTRSW